MNIVGENYFAEGIESERRQKHPFFPEVKR